MNGTAGPAAAAAARPVPVPAGGPDRPEAGSPAPVIEAAGLASGYRGRTVWSGADFSVGAGEFLTVLGPNGAGKSTLLRMVLGLLRPAEGTLRVFRRAPGATRDRVRAAAARSTRTSASGRPTWWVSAWTDIAGA
jgi:zinc/manganese transport system ATP-binding protein